MTTRKIWWGDFKTADFDAIDAEATIAVLPVAAIEQHGPHLPLDTDTAIMSGMISAVGAQLPDDLDVRFLPVQAVGKSDEHVSFHGTLTVPAADLIAHWTAIGESVARTGIRKLVIVTSHGGNEDVAGIVARNLRVRHAMMAVRTSWGRFGLPDGLFSEREKSIGIHGGDYETSLMLHFAAGRVDMGKAADFRSSTETARAAFKHLAPQSPHGFAWLAEDLNRQGVTGEASLATAAKGEAAALHQARGFIELLEDMRRARLDEWIATS